MSTPGIRKLRSGLRRIAFCLPAPTTALLLLGLAGGLASAPASGADDSADLSGDYGFLPLEIFKLEERSGNLLAADMNADGLLDLVAVDNSNSRIDLLIQRRSPEDAPKSKPAEVNDLANDWRFEHRKVPVDKQITTLAVGDFNGDKRTDLAYFGTPDRLIVRFQPEQGEWNSQVSFRLPDVSTAQWTVAAGDLNGDGRTDLAVLGERETYLLYQTEDGQPGTPRTLMNTSDKLGLAQVADLNGDGRSDLCYSATEDQERTFCARLQQPDGQLGPELRFDINGPRSITLTEVDGKPESEILAIDSRTGRLRMLNLQPSTSKPGELAGRLIQYGFGKSGSGRDRDLATGDLDGNGLTDVVVTDPEAAQMIVFRQRPKDGLDLGTPFPGLLGATQVRIARFGSGKTAGAEVIVLSDREKIIGTSRLADGRLTFPQAIEVVDEPVAMDIADAGKDGKPELFYISRKREGRSSSYALRLLQRDSDGQWKPGKPGKPGGKAEAIPLELRGTPDRLVQTDADHDGRPDFLVFLGLDRGVQVFSMREDGSVEEIAQDGGIGLGDSVNAGAVFLGQLGKPAVLVAQDNFARNLELDENHRWKVLDQYNADESSAKIVGTATINLDGQPGNEVVLIDTGIRRLRVLRQEENLFRRWREVELGNLQYKSSHIADLNGDGQDDLLLFGRSRFSVLYAGRTDPELREMASFESAIEQTWLADAVAGDLNGDGQADIAMIDTRSHYVELVNYDRKEGLRHALQFKVFEEKSFANRNATGSEPREAVIADVTGDGRADLILLAHDRLLLYPQDSGASRTAER